MPGKSLPTRGLRDRPDLDQLKRQAKELLDAFVAGRDEAVAEVNAHYRGADAGSFALHDAQFVLARAHGFASWPKLKAYVDGVTMTRLAEAVRAGDVTSVRVMLRVRPELAHMEMGESNEHRALHYAVLNRLPEMVRILMEHGADARIGIYPHRVATSAFTIATERGYSEIVDIIESEERRRNSRHRPDAGSTTELHGHLEAVSGENDGTELTIGVAVAQGDVDWILAHRADSGRWTSDLGLLTAAVRHERPDVLRLLLELGLDPDERIRLDDLEEVVYSWGAPLRECGNSGKLAMAELLLERGADPNTNVYAASTALYGAYVRHDELMINLLERHGSFLDAGSVGHLRLPDRAMQMLEDEASGRLRQRTFYPGDTLAEALLWSGASGGSVEIVRMALERLDWPRDDRRWRGNLEATLYPDPEWDRSAYLTCFRMILAHCDATALGPYGITILHDVIASRSSMGKMTTGEQVAFAATLLDAGARMDVRDELLKSTPLGWACRWGRVELVRLLLARGADPVEPDAEPWATPAAWAEKMGHEAALAVLRERAR